MEKNTRLIGILTIKLGLTDTEAKLLLDMKDFEVCIKNRATLAKKLKVQPDRVSRVLKSLKNKGLIYQVGNKQSRRWYALTDKAREEVGAPKYSAWGELLDYEQLLQETLAKPTTVKTLFDLGGMSTKKLEALLDLLDTGKIVYENHKLHLVEQE